MLHLKKYLSSPGSDFKSDRDWRVLFGGFLILTVVVFSISVYLFQSLNTLEIVGRAKVLADPATHLDQLTLEQVVATVDEKKARFETLLTAPPAIVDPAR